jgi:hypothetical protein
MNLKEERRSIYSLIYLVVIPLIVGAVIIPGCFIGCISITPDSMEQLDSLTERWVYILEQYADYKANKPAPAPDTPEGPGPDAPVIDTSIDAVDYGKLIWQYGGFAAAGARLDSPRISSLRTNGRELTYKWEVGLSGWGLGHSDAGAICAVFFEQPDGRWIGGKFDWVSTSRSSRELKHVESYKDWPSSGIKLPHSGRVAFVVTSANGKLRSNVLTATR